MTNTLLAQGFKFDNGGSSSTDLTNPILGKNLQGLSGAEFFQKLLPALISLIFVVASIIFFFMFVTGAIQWISSGGDKQGLESAKGKITNAIVGIIILFSVFAIIKVIENFFGVNILTIDIGPLVIQ